MRTHYLSNEELEQYWFRYKTDSEIHGTSLEKFCEINRISYKAMDNWRRQTKNRIYPVEIIEQPEERPEIQTPHKEEESLTQDQEKQASVKSYSRYTSCKHRTGPKGPDSALPSAESSPTQGKAETPGIMLTLKATNGLYISQRNLDYGGLRRLVEKLEGIC